MTAVRELHVATRAGQQRAVCSAQRGIIATIAGAHEKQYGEPSECPHRRSFFATSGRSALDAEKRPHPIERTSSGPVRGHRATEIATRFHAMSPGRNALRESAHEVPPGTVAASDARICRSIRSSVDAIEGQLRAAGASAGGRAVVGAGPFVEGPTGTAPSTWDVSSVD